ncbi:MAG: class I SAM-dependent methyltransferase [Methanoregula sp.]|uniref:class I SAM-dependent methyltransferase n=1 Tax=Methanoregula sp. TaxID=2052170 RepID=UPI003C15E518
MTRVDSSQTAISIAEKNAREKGGRCRFIVADLPVNRQEVTGTFDFAFDWELLHHILPKDHQTYIRNVLRILNPLCHIPLRLLPRTGPPVWREREIPENTDRDNTLFLIRIRTAGPRLPVFQDP